MQVGNAVQPQAGERSEGRGGQKATLSARGVSKVYGSGDLSIWALREVDIDLYEGELVVLLGASGSGKSTLLNIVGGLDKPTSGQVFFDGSDITGYDDGQLTRFRRDHVGFVFQFYNLVPSLTAEENVALVTEIAPNPMTPAKALELVGLGERLTHFPAQLSGGEQQRVAIARAIAKRPRILLCDEPTGALDSQTGVIVLEAIDRINKELGTTTALITHNVGIAAMSSRVIQLADGQVQEVHINDQKVPASEIRW